MIRRGHQHKQVDVTNRSISEPGRPRLAATRTKSSTRTGESIQKGRRSHGEITLFDPAEGLFCPKNLARSLAWAHPSAQVFCALTSIALALALAWDYFKASASRQNNKEAATLGSQTRARRPLQVLYINQISSKDLEMKLSGCKKAMAVWALASLAWVGKPRHEPRGRIEVEVERQHGFRWSSRHFPLEIGDVEALRSSFPWDRPGEHLR